MILKLITCYSLRLLPTSNHCPAWLINDVLQVERTKFLGITIDKNLIFKHHLSNLCLRLSRTIPLLLKVKHFAPSNILKCLYYAHIFPQLTYCNPIWSQTYPCHMSQINVLHKKVIRIITNSDYNDHTQPLFKQMNILNLADLSKLILASHMYKRMHSNNLTTQPTHNYQTRNQSALYIPRPKLTLFKHSILYSGPKTWNDVPEIIKQSKSLPHFKKQLKSYLINSY